MAPLPGPAANNQEVEGVAVPPLSYTGLGHLKSDTCVRSHLQLTVSGIVKIVSLKKRRFSLKARPSATGAMLTRRLIFFFSEFKHLVGCGVFCFFKTITCHFIRV